MVPTRHAAATTMGVATCVVGPACGLCNCLSGAVASHPVLLHTMGLDEE